MLAGLVALAIATLPALPAHARSTPASQGDEAAILSELERLYARGEERFHAGDLAGAIEAFSEGLAQIGDDGPPRLRAYFSVSLAIAHLDRYDTHENTADLERAHELLTATVERDADTLRNEPRLEALARRNLDRARAHMPPAPATDRSEDTTDDPPAPAGPAQANPSGPPPVPATSSRRGRAAEIGLLVSGTALVAGGLAVIIDGATLERRARAIAEDPPQGDQKAYIEEEVPRLARIRYAIAGPVLAAGIGLLVGGGILLHRAARRRHVVVQPAIGIGHASVLLRARF